MAIELLLAGRKSIKELLQLDNLEFPDYQRPYKWSAKNIEDLLTDINHAIDESKRHPSDYKYRIGTILLHEDEKTGKLYIVDGQQRVISVALICLALNPDFRCRITDVKFTNEVTKKNISDNLMFIRQWFPIKTQKEKAELLNALDTIIEVIVITVNEQSEAFQLFDSQNSRGKSLYPHDLLKAFHLREMSNNLFEMEHAVKMWEEVEPSEIKDLFKDYLFPVCNWTLCRKSESFSEKHIDLFKGTTLHQAYTYALRAFRSSPYFQINEPFIAGGEFFNYVGHYLQLLTDIRRELNRDDTFLDIREVLENEAYKRSTGFKYCVSLFYCTLLCYYDRFHRFDKMAIMRLFTWSFMIRVDMEHLGFDSINKYAIGDSNYQYSNHLPMFSIISNARKHTDISNMAIMCRRNPNNLGWDGLATQLLNLNGLENYGE